MHVCRRTAQRNDEGGGGAAVAAPTVVIELQLAIRVPNELPFLKAVCWQLADVRVLAPAEMLRRYEYGQPYRGIVGDLDGQELAFARALNARYRGILDV